MIEGRCLCGAVQVRAERLSDGMSACFCTNCTRWGGGFQLALKSLGGVEVTGPVKVYRAVPFAERAWCDTCGSSLWLKDDDGPHEFCPGLFPNAAGAGLSHIVYADRMPDGLDFANVTDRVSAAEYERDNPFVPEGDMP